ncbi:MAG: iron ABC transporter permease [bacterium]|nr:iron ABC transporter permease [bacterium]
MKGLMIAALALLTALLVFALLAWGSVSISAGDLWRALIGSSEAQEVHRRILYDLRLPKALAALVAGASLAVAGLLMQTLFGNPLAGPYVLGINSGAGLGVALLVLASGGLVTSLGGGLALAAAAIGGAGLVLVMVVLLAERVQSAVTLLILGLMFGAMANGVVSILIYFAQPDQIQAFLLWTFGSFRALGTQQLAILSAICLPALALALLLPKPLNALLLGEEYAASMGVEVKQLRRRLLWAASLLAGAVTAFCGPIAFLGIAVPHLCRFLFKTADHRILLPACIFLGADMALAAEWVAGMPGSSSALPINAILALVGAPVVFWVVLRRAP